MIVTSSMLRGALLVTAVAILTARSSAQAPSSPAPEPGTYRVQLCSRPCTTNEPNITALWAVIVLLDDAAAVAEPARATLAALERVEYRSPTDRQRAPNACFKVTRRERSLTADYFGITPIGSTRWQHSAPGGFSLLVYHSIDANYALKWTSPGLLSRGEGWARTPDIRMGPIRNAYFEATRLGPPDVSQCR